MEQLATLDSYCQLSKTSLVFKRDVTQDEWKHVFNSLKLIEGCVQFWIGDCLKYREQKWGMYDDVAEETGYEKETLRQYKQVAEKVESGLRNPNLDFSHHKAVAPLPPEKQEIFLKKAVEEKLTVRELRKEIQQDRFSELVAKIPEQNSVSKLYDVIVIDPPWNYGTQYDPDNRRVASPYPEMTIEELKERYIPSKDNCIMWLWTTHKFIWEAKELLEHWGFTYKAILVWDKGMIGMGYWLRMQCEFCLLGIKGQPFWNNTNIRDIISEARREHSRKPDLFYEIVDKLCVGEKLDDFSRQQRNGWDSRGIEINKFVE